MKKQLNRIEIKGDFIKSVIPDTLSERENYKFLTGSIIPRPVALVTTLSEKGVLNGAPFSFFNIVSSHPPMISISVQRRRGEKKDTGRNAIFQKAFVVHITDESTINSVNQTAANLKCDESEIEAADLTPVKSETIDVPGVHEAKVRMECHLERVIPLGDDETNCDLLIGRVVCYHIDGNLYENGRIDANLLQPVSRLAGSNYATLGDIFSLERPK